MKFEDLWEQYKQDETHFNIDVARRIYNDRQNEIDALQKRIENVLKYVGDDFEDFYEGEMVKCVHEILKGDKND